jgi:hypothetical protein
MAKKTISNKDARIKSLTRWIFARNKIIEVALFIFVILFTYQVGVIIDHNVFMSCIDNNSLCIHQIPGFEYVVVAFMFGLVFELIAFMVCLGLGVAVKKWISYNWEVAEDNARKIVNENDERTK